MILIQLISMNIEYLSAEKYGPDVLRYLDTPIEVLPPTSWTLHASSGVDAT
jgi:predicted ATPase